MFRSVIALLAATLIWVPALHYFYRPSPEKIRGGLAAHYSALWASRAELDEAIAGMRRVNAEWDFMARTFLVLAFANLALSNETERLDILRAIDAIIDETLAIEKEKGMHFFLMSYSRRGEFLVQPPRSVFIDGEIALMLGARRLVEENEKYAALHRRRAALIAERMRASPTLSMESYPDEVWTFCNSVALASLKMLDVLDGTDHSLLIAAWIRQAQEKRTEEKTGLLFSSHALDGRPRDGPEGSSIFMVVHMLQILDPDYARDQYQRAKKELIRDVFGFGYAREWPADVSQPHEDVDSGPTIPVLGANAGASGMAILAAAAFDDRETLTELLSSLELAAFPIETGEGRRYRASNSAGDAVMLYALAQGPLWRLIEGGRR